MDTAPFQIEEATIDELHQAIRDGRTTCVAVVQHYLARVRAFNGVASMLVTADGAPGAPRARAGGGGGGGGAPPPASASIGVCVMGMSKIILQHPQG